MKTLYLLCGLSFSGKTTLARKIVERRQLLRSPHPPNGPITVGIDGGYVRAAHKQGWFEVIAGKSVVASGGKLRAKY
jgi:adenylylsulfate kinase-like enzyme